MADFDRYPSAILQKEGEKWSGTADWPAFCVETLHAFCVAAMVKAGLREADARITADVLVTTDTWGTFTHGTKHLRSYSAQAACWRH